MKTKEEVIKEAYGEYYDRCKPDENGWSFEKPYFNICTLFFCMNSELRTYGDIPNNYLKCWRPKSLQGIENNNGWIRIENKAQYDNLENGDYEWYNINNGRYDKGDLWDYGVFTHYKIVPKILSKPPIY